MTQTSAPGYPDAPTYDAAGDVVDDNVNQYLYDAEGRICAVWGANVVLGPDSLGIGYLYDASGNRVAKGTITSPSCDTTTNGFTQTFAYVVDQAGNQLTEVDAYNRWHHTNVYAAGKLIATYGAQNSGVQFHIDDPLGTRRAQVSSTGALDAVYTSLPFGDGLASNGTANDPTENHFTGKERDTESGNDYMFARYYNSATGRFLSPDWSAKVTPVPYAVLADPQSLNLYSYVRNNPLSRTDPDRHCDSSAGASANTKCQAVKDLHTSDSMKGYLKRMEGVVGSHGAPMLTAQDIGDGHITVGWGHVDDSMKKGTKIDASQAQEFFHQDVAAAEKQAASALSSGGHEFSQGEFNAVVDLRFNGGPSMLTSDKSPHLMNDIQSGDYDGMSNELRYTKTANGASLPGLGPRSDDRQKIDRGTDPSELTQ